MDAALSFVHLCFEYFRKNGPNFQDGPKALCLHAWIFSDSRKPLSRRLNKDSTQRRFGRRSEGLKYE